MMFLKNIYYGFSSILLITQIRRILTNGYILKRLEEIKLVFIIGVCFNVRESFHTYQDLESLPMILYTSIVFGLYY